MEMKGTVNLAHLGMHFSDDDKARELLEAMRWPNGAACPHCGGADPYRLTVKASGKNKVARKGLWKCSQCRKQFTVTVGTIFEGSRIGISKWLLAIHLMCASKKGMSAHQLHRMLGITYKCAWFVAHRLRAAMAEGGDLMTGVVEVDETYIGGRRRGGKRGRPGPDSHKSPVVALVERGGKVRAFHTPRVTGDNLKQILKSNLSPDATMMTDEFPVYGRMGHKAHHTVNHKSREYVRGAVHTNTVEGFFSILKRGINGVYQHVSKGHLHRYCDEFAFRYNYRTALGVTDSQRTAALVAGAEGKRLTYAQPS